MGSSEHWDKLAGKASASKAQSRVEEPDHPPRNEPGRDLAGTPF